MMIINWVIRVMNSTNDMVGLFISLLTVCVVASLFFFAAAYHAEPKTKFCIFPELKWSCVEGRAAQSFTTFGKAMERSKKSFDKGEKSYKGHHHGKKGGHHHGKKSHKGDEGHKSKGYEGNKSKWGGEYGNKNHGGKGKGWHGHFGSH